MNPCLFTFLYLVFGYILLWYHIYNKKLLTLYYIFCGYTMLFVVYKYKLFINVV